MPANANSGSAAVTLTCAARGLDGPDGFSGIEDPYDIFVLYDRTFPLFNLTSDNIQTSCAAPPPGAAPAPGPGGVAGGGEDG